MNCIRIETNSIALQKKKCLRKQALLDVFGTRGAKCIAQLMYRINTISLEPPLIGIPFFRQRYLFSVLKRIGLQVILVK